MRLNTSQGVNSKMYEKHKTVITRINKAIELWENGKVILTNEKTKFLVIGETANYVVDLIGDYPYLPSCSCYDANISYESTKRAEVPAFLCKHIVASIMAYNSQRETERKDLHTAFKEKQNANKLEA